MFISRSQSIIEHTHTHARAHAHTHTHTQIFAYHDFHFSNGDFTIFAIGLGTYGKHIHKCVYTEFVYAGVHVNSTYVIESDNRDG